MMGQGARPAFRGRPLVLLGGFVGIWGVARTSMIPGYYAFVDPVAFEASPIPAAGEPDEGDWETGPLGSLAVPEVGAVSTPPPLRATSFTHVTSPVRLSPIPTISAPVVQVARPMPQPLLFPYQALPSSVGRKNTPAFTAAPSLAPAPPPTPRRPFPDNRWSASAWALWRGDRDAAAPGGGSLPLYGASQAGMRVAYQVRPRQVELYARLSSPLQSSSGKEAAAGVAVRPLSALNLAVAVEQRIRLDKGGRTAPAVMAYGGFGPHRFGPVEAEGYAQVGVVGIKHRAAFADGALTVRRKVGELGPIPVFVGAGVWGGAQPGVSRLDIGPRASADIRLTGKTHIRVAVDWRERVAGNGRPDSGPAVTVGADF